MMLKNNKGNKKEFGQSLFEVVLALAVSAIITMGIVSLTSKIINTSSNSKNKSQANRYSSEAIEFLRTQKEFLGYSVFKTKIEHSVNGYWCLKTLELLSAYEITCGATDFVTEGGVNTIFIRQVQAKNITNKTMDIHVKVTWQDESGTHESYTLGAISNW